MLKAAKARALIHKRVHATSEDVLAVAPAILRHRIIPTFNAEAAGVDTDGIVSQILEKFRAHA
jgi:MoxR-like ATPase